MKYFLTIIVWGSILFATPSLTFIALEDENWHVVICDDTSDCHIVPTDKEPRVYDYDFNTGNLIYIGSDKDVHIIMDNNESILLKSNKNAYTNPLFIEDGQKIMLVELINGKSKRTKIISIDLKDKKIKTLHSQHSTTLEPYINNNIDLYYVNTSCVEGCNKIIQEIWYKDFITKEANQLTLLNALSHQPHSTKDNSMVYFSSNKSGNYHIWVYNKNTYTTRQLTFGEGTDGFPSSHQGEIYFLRRIENHTTLMRYSKEGNLTKIILKQNYTKIRNLKVKL